ncbi:MAG: carotenoid 1,2-hydratase [Deltaproteobacteria bacterium]|nr:carotenoid 1,2-hydratase [Deltaproteobacteria bacterium]
MIPVRRGLKGPVALPVDDAFLPKEKVQWWYWTGHLDDEAGKHYGFEVVFFAFPDLGSQLCQVALTDVAANRFYFKEYIIDFQLPVRIPDVIDLATKKGEVTARGPGGREHLFGTIKDDLILDLELEAQAPPVLHYGGNAHPYRFGGYTYYYSREDMIARGTIKMGDKTLNVTGTAWFDRQYGALYRAIDKGWQWFAIRLDDGRRIMLFDFRGKEADIERYGSLTDDTNLTRDLGPNDYRVTIKDTWKSPHTGCTYPMGWDVTIGDLNLKVEPMVVDQELRATHGYWAGPEYWEGACRVSGDQTGTAYVELNGYCRGMLGAIGKEKPEKGVSSD